MLSLYLRSALIGQCSGQLDGHLQGVIQRSADGMVAVGAHAVVLQEVCVASGVSVAGGAAGAVLAGAGCRGRSRALQAPAPAPHQHQPPL